MQEVREKFMSYLVKVGGGVKVRRKQQCGCKVLLMCLRNSEEDGVALEE